MVVVEGLDGADRLEIRERPHEKWSWPPAGHGDDFGAGLVDVAQHRVIPAGVKDLETVDSVWLLGRSDPPRILREVLIKLLFLRAAAKRLRPHATPDAQPWCSSAMRPDGRWLPFGGRPRASRRSATATKSGVGSTPSQSRASR